MRLLVLGAAIGCAAFVPEIIGQDAPLHLTSRTKTANISFSADSIERQDPATSRPSPYASLVRLRGNVQIRTCCVQAPSWTKKVSEIPAKQVVLMRADEADFHEDTGEMEVRGNVKVNFQNYPK
jgi:lipopolysaccharide assembly outer membrane protein LptD (OstA)